MKNKAKKFKPDADYAKLVENIRKLLDEAYVKGVDLNREHFLNCYACECFESMSKEGSRGVYDKDGVLTGLDVDFKVLDVKKRSYVLKRGGLRWRTTYHYTCGVCGFEQRVCHVDEFSQSDAKGK